MQVRSSKQFLYLFLVFFDWINIVYFQDILFSTSAPVNFSIQLQLNLNLYKYHFSNYYFFSVLVSIGFYI